MTNRPIRLALVLVLGLVVSACNGSDPPVEPTVTAVPVPTIQPADPATEATPPPPPAPTTEATPTPEATEEPQAATLEHYLVREGGERLWVEPVSFTYDPDEVGGAVARAALTAMLAATPSDGLVQPAPAGTQLRDVAVINRVLHIDLSSQVTSNPGSGAAGEAVFAQALAHTGAQFDTVDAVLLLVEGEAVEELWGHLDWSAPIEPDPFAIVPIDITEVTAEEGGAIELAGTANVFEAVFTIELLAADGSLVEPSFVMASCGSGCRGEWSHRFSGREAGTYTVVARESDPSDGEGFAPFEVQTTVTIPG